MLKYPLIQELKIPHQQLKIFFNSMNIFLTFFKLNSNYTRGIQLLPSQLGREGVHQNTNVLKKEGRRIVSKQKLPNNVF